MFLSTAKLSLEDTDDIYYDSFILESNVYEASKTQDIPFLLENIGLEFDNEWKITGGLKPSWEVCKPKLISLILAAEQIVFSQIQGEIHETGSGIVTSLLLKTASCLVQFQLSSSGVRSG